MIDRLVAEFDGAIARLDAAAGEDSPRGLWKRLSPVQQRRLMLAAETALTHELRERGAHPPRRWVMRSLAMRELRRAAAHDRVGFIPLPLIILLAQILLPILIDWLIDRRQSEA